MPTSAPLAAAEDGDGEMAGRPRCADAATTTTTTSSPATASATARFANRASSRRRRPGRLEVNTPLCDARARAPSTMISTSASTP